MQRRIDPQNGSGQSPMIVPEKIVYELADRQQAIAAGGLGALVQTARRLDLRQAINDSITLLKLHRPYDEADHVLNIALNLLAGGGCLEHLEDRRCDEAYLNALGAERIPDPTTAGDFCRRFQEMDILRLMNGFNQVRERVWKEQPDAFFDCAIIEADGTQVQTSAEKKQGIGINYKGEWGYHPLVVTLANTREPLFIVNRSGNRPSHENAAFFFDLAVERCRKAGFRKVVLRGDTDFALTENFDRWSEQNVEFVFGIDAMPKLVGIAKTLAETEWKTLHRRKHKPPSRRAKRPRCKEQIVEQNGYLNKQLVSEQIAEFDYQPGKCGRSYRIIAQLKQCALSAPLDNLLSNWAYMVIASLAWSLKAWATLSIQPAGNGDSRAEQTRQKAALLAMDFTTFRDRVLMVPAQIIRGGRQIVYRLLSYRPTLDYLLLIVQNVHRPLRC
ncbi:transposase [Lignipirellula cremea]|uniref:Transposase DDE domain-containing protein n=1 Tax=Lignipirellula cremea TaxID=2528010 RepID=A0A518DVE2_9BACT|nr:transposase [Lignipirellula cremea]QDU95794.1 hypothetical protein Pla8534_36110 [Lignipirellula cremea]